MLIDLHPGLILICGGLLVPFLSGPVRSFWLLVVPLLALWSVLVMPQGSHWSLAFLGLDLVPGRVDNLSRLFALGFSLVTVLGFIFARQVRDDWQHLWTLVYAGSALGVVLAGDWFSLYVFWELMAVASTFVILCGRSAASRGAAFRYVLVHLTGGLILLAGILLLFRATGSLTIDPLALQGAAAWLIFIGIGINAAVWPVHAWLVDAYPTASASGTVFLSVLTTKSAVYLMARTFAGTELLIWLGGLMALIPLLLALIENDARKALCYVLINQVGFMLVGVGIGTDLALNGTAAHALAHIVYDALLFMALGSVLHMTGRIRLTELGGLFRSMPLTGLAYLAGAASISALPLFSGFTTKSMIVSAAAHEHLALAWLVLEIASAGACLVAGLAIPYFIFFGPRVALRAKEPPADMLLAQGLAALFCLLIGLFPGRVYGLLPHPVDYHPFGPGHLVGQLELILFVGLGFALLLRAGLFPSPGRSLNLDTDWVYRKLALILFRAADRGLNGLNDWAERFFVGRLAAGIGRFFSQGSARLIWLAVGPVFYLGGARGPDLAAKKERLAQRLARGTLPVGLSAAAALTVFLILFAVQQG